MPLSHTAQIAATFLRQVSYGASVSQELSPCVPALWWPRHQHHEGHHRVLSCLWGHGLSADNWSTTMGVQQGWRGYCLLVVAFPRLLFTQCPVKMQQLGAELSYLHHCDTVEMTGVGSGSDVCNAQIWGQTVTEEKKSSVSVCLWEGGGQGKQRKRALTLFGSSLSCVLSCFSRVWFFVSPWTAAHQAPLSMGILQARILEWVAMPFSRGFFLFSYFHVKHIPLDYSLQGRNQNFLIHCLVLSAQQSGWHVTGIK